MCRIGRTGVILGAMCVVAPVALAQTVVDFGKAPKPGLTYRVVDQRVAEAVGKAAGERAVEAKGEPPRKRSHTCHSVFIQTISDVRGARVVALERDYLAWFADGPFVAAGDSPRADPPVPDARKKTAIRNVTLRARREGDGETWRVEQKRGERWGAPRGRVIVRGYDRRDPCYLRYPVIPLPRSSKRVGDTWQFDFERDFLYFPSTVLNGKADTPGRAWHVTYCLERIRDYNGRRCAVIAVTAEVHGRRAGKGVESSFDLSARATCFYSLVHRVVIGMDLESESEQWIRGRGYALGGAGREKRTVTVQILKDGKPPVPASSETAKQR